MHEESSPGDAHSIGTGPVVYLDFDGVLHPDRVYRSPRKGPYLKDAKGHRLFEHAELLEQLLQPYPDIRVVLSTSWVMHYGFMGAAKRLPERLRALVIGATFHSRMSRETFDAMPRGLQVWADVLRRRPLNWLAVDDDHLHWPTWCRDHLVRTHSTLGLAEPSVTTQLKEKLAFVASTPNSSGEGSRI